MSTYSSLLSMSPADWAAGGEEDMAAAAAAVSSYLSFFDADECSLTPQGSTLFHALQADVDCCASGEAAGSSGGHGEPSPTTEAAAVALGPPPAATTRDTINESSSSGSGGSRNGLPVTAGRKGRIAFKMRSDVDVLDDGYRWRKYGKKMVKNSPNPRNYYRCSNEGCHVKKRVERERDDARFVITTYDGVHNHHPAAPPPPRPFDRLVVGPIEDHSVQDEGPAGPITTNARFAL